MKFVDAVTANEKWAFFLFCLLAHAWGIGADLPFVYNPDEPHHLNVAAAYSTGDLNPHDFKYPALWSYVVAGLLGAGYAVAGTLGLVRTAEEYGVRFLTSPAPFYLGVRLFSALLVSCAVLLVYDAGARFRDRLHGRLMALFFLFTPQVLSYGRDATLYGLLVFLVALALHQLLGLAATGAKRYYLTAGAAVGLAAGTHYLAAPLLLLIPLLHAVRAGPRQRWAWPALGALAAGAAFFATNPFILLDWRSFLQTLHSLDAIQKVSAGFHLREQLVNTLRFLDAWGLGLAAIGGGFLLIPRERRLETASWLLPWLVFMPYLAASHYGHLPRYSLPVHAPFVVAAAAGLHALLTRLGMSRRLQLLAGLAFFLPSSVQALGDGFPPSLQDTRTLAKAWVETHLPAGSKILVFDPYGVPPLNMAPAQLERLHRRCVELDHPRKHYFRLLLQSAKCPSYEIYTVRRTNRETMDLPERDERSYQAQDAIDPDALGLAGMRAIGIDYLVLDPLFDRARSAAPWRSQMLGECPLLYEIGPEEGRVKGPALRIYALAGAAAPAR